MEANPMELAHLAAKLGVTIPKPIGKPANIRQPACFGTPVPDAVRKLDEPFA
jgi:hypothetical protein